MSEQIPSPLSIEIGDSQYQKIGLQCISPGISARGLDNEKLQIFQRSKSIAQQQKKQIQRMNLDSSIEKEDIADHDTDTPSDTDAPDDVVAVHSERSEHTIIESNAGTITPVMSSAENARSLFTSKSRNRSLKRNNVPRPLELEHRSHDGRTTLNNVVSAPAAVTRHNFEPSASKALPRSRVVKPRVIYRGRTAPQYSIPYTPCLQVSTPAALPPIHPMCMRRPPLYTTTLRTPLTNAETTRGVPNGASTTTTTTSTTTTAAAAAPTTTAHLRSSKQPLSEFIEIEDRSTSPVIEGDIRLVHETFQFQFDSQSQSLDKKMFLNICSKIWDDVVSR